MEPTISVTTPISPAFERVRSMLFAPFNLEKWVKLGFCAFLATLGEGGGGGSGAQFEGDGWDGQDIGRDAQRALDEAGQWLEANTGLAVLLVSGVLLLILGLVALVVWLRARGRFMLLDGVVKDRGAVAAPWREYRAEANSLFGFEFLLGMAGLVLVVLAMVVAAMTVVPILSEGGELGDRWGVFALLFAGGFLVVTAYAVIGLFLKDFVVPAMYARRIGVMEAWRVVLDEVIGPRVGTTVLYVLMKIVIAIAMAVLVVAFGCGTLCIGFCIMAIPVVGSILLLPLSVFERSFSLYFLEQLGGPWRLFPDEPAEAPAEDAW